MPRRAAPSKPEPPRGPSRFQVFLRSLDHRVVDQAAQRLTQTIERAGGHVEGPIPLPSAPAPIAGLRPHTRSLEVVDPRPELLALLRRFDLPTGVEIELAS